MKLTSSCAPNKQIKPTMSAVDIIFLVTIRNKEPSLFSVLENPKIVFPSNKCCGNGEMKTKAFNSQHIQWWSAASWALITFFLTRQRPPVWANQAENRQILISGQSIRAFDCTLRKNMHVTSSALFQAITQSSRILVEPILCNQINCCTSCLAAAFCLLSANCLRLC